MRLSFGPKQQGTGYHFSTSDYESYQVILVETGQVDMLVHKQVTPVFPGGVMVLPLGSVFSLSCGASGDGYTGVYAILHDQAGDPDEGPLGNAYEGPARVALSTPTCRRLSEILMEQVRNPAYDSQLLLHSLGRSFLELGRQLAAEQDESEAGSESAEYWVDRAAQVIETSIYSNQRVTDLLADLGLSYRQLTRHFRAEKDMTPKQYQLRCRLHEARRLLSGTRQPISTIALDLGFASSQHFATAFRKAFGCTPTAYRAALLHQSRSPSTASKCLS